MVCGLLLGFAWTSGLCWHRDFGLGFVCRVIGFACFVLLFVV